MHKLIYLEGNQASCYSLLPRLLTENACKFDLWVSRVAHEIPRELYGGVVLDWVGFFEVFLQFVVTRFEARGLQWTHETPGSSRMGGRKTPLDLCRCGEKPWSFKIFGPHPGDPENRVGDKLAIDAGALGEAKGAQ